MKSIQLKQLYETELQVNVFDTPGKVRHPQYFDYQAALANVTIKPIKMNHLFEMDSIRLSFGSRVILSDIYMKCTTGKITGLLGRNGQGKSCLLNIIYGERQYILADGKTHLLKDPAGIEELGYARL